MNMKFIENFQLIGYYVNACKTVKEFMHELKDYVSYTEEYFHGCSFKEYMNNEYDESDTYKSVVENVHEDVFIWIEYTDGTHFCYCDSREGNFKLNGIKWAYISDGNGYTVYKYDLLDEWINVEDVLDENEEEAIKTRTPVETIKLRKALLAEETAKNTENSAEVTTEETAEEPEAEEQEATPAEETAKSTENSVFGYKINVLEALKEVGYTSTRIRKEKLFAQVTLQKFRDGDTNISLQTVADICNLTGLQPWDILDFSAKSTEKSADETTEEITPVEMQMKKAFSEDWREQ